MLIALPAIVAADEAQRMCAALLAGEWVDGRATAGPQAATAKHNRQLKPGTELAERAANRVLDLLDLHALYRSAALPLKVLPPMFNRYEAGESFGTHIDNSIRSVPGSGQALRSDLSATLFLSDPESYDGGELVIEDAYGEQSVKLPAGHMILYPAKSRHRVNPVSRGVRVAGFFWIQSMVRDDHERAMLFELDQSIQSLAGERGISHPDVVRLTGVYHNLLRRFADC